MKHSNLILAIFCAAVLLQSCKNETSQLIKNDPTPLMGMTIIKLSSSDYLNNVVVEPDYLGGDYEHRCKIRGGGAVCQELFLGTSPYIALPKGYYLIDWRWGDFIYEPTNFLIGARWTDVKDRQQIWEYNSKTIVSKKFLKEYTGSSYKQIDKYLNIAPPTRMDKMYAYTPEDYVRPNWMYKYNTFADMPESQIEDYKAEVRYQDSLQSVYIKRISQIIEAGDLDDAFGIYKY